ncbi:hypothetical protein U0070_021965 [Myodes glareolus]|uniref:Uncharacterized protein n=1 Tax=Myodes glareolus TaxID=447135 RepID=A0AAW0HFW9_MYOGA
MDVTTTSTKIGKFEASFFHLAFEEEFGRVNATLQPSTVLPSILMARATGAVAETATSASTSMTLTHNTLSLRSKKLDLSAHQGSCSRRF